MLKIINYFMVFLAALTLFGSKSKVPEQKSGRDGEIVFVKVYSNYAWGYQFSGSFVDTEGNIYTFDFDDDEKNAPSRDELIDKLYEIKDTSKSTKSVNGKIIDSCAAYIPEVNADAELKTEFTACDAGQSTIYAVDEDNNLIELATSGDVTGKIEDKAADKILNSLDSTGYISLNSFRL